MLQPILVALHERPLARLETLTMVLVAPFYSREELHDAALVLVPTENLILQIPDLKQITVRFLDESGEEPDPAWYEWMFREKLPNMLPTLAQRGLLASGSRRLSGSPLLDLKCVHRRDPGHFGWG